MEWESQGEHTIVESEYDCDYSYGKCLLLGLPYGSGCCRPSFQRGGGNIVLVICHWVSVVALDGAERMLDADRCKRHLFPGDPSTKLGLCSTSTTHVLPQTFIYLCLSIVFLITSYEYGTRSTMWSDNTLPKRNKSFSRSINQWGVWPFAEFIKIAAGVRIHSCFYRHLQRQQNN
ncbi:hypothetical protein DFS34DRAFT_318486 [Phlyctochytrium arcticum]|nr:hypothetical protein DFS34DRAFT_318486 [Phlyctochytrium arcticum]